MIANKGLKYIMAKNTTPELKYARELLLNLWQWRASQVMGEKSRKKEIIELIYHYTSIDDAELLDDIDFMISELSKARNQITKAKKKIKE